MLLWQLRKEIYWQHNPVHVYSEVSSILLNEVYSMINVLRIAAGVFSMLSFKTFKRLLFYFISFQDIGTIIQFNKFLTAWKC